MNGSLKLGFGKVKDAEDGFFKIFEDNCGNRLLCDWEITEAIRKKIIGITNFDKSSLGPISYDLHLGNAKVFYTEIKYDVREDIILAKYDKFHPYLRDTIVIDPLTAVILITKEEVKLPSYITGLFSPRSNLARILMFSYSSVIDPGYRGPLSITAFNPSQHIPIIIPKNHRIAQIMFMTHNKVKIDYQHRKSSKNVGKDRMIKKVKKDLEYVSER